VDHVIVTDNASDDGTREILSDFAKSAPVTVLDEPGNDYSQYRWVTRMARLAIQEFGAEWIINNDADEFWIPPSGTLREALEKSTADVIICDRRNMVLPYDELTDEAPWYERVVYRASAPTPPQPMADPLTSPLANPHFMNALPGKVILRGEGLVAVEQGNHGARYDRDVRTEPSEIVVYHFPVRSREQFEVKIREGGAAYARNAELPPGIGWHWRRWLAKIENEGLDAALSEALPSGAMVRKGLRSGAILRDTSMVDDVRRASADPRRC